LDKNSQLKKIENVRSFPINKQTGSYPIAVLNEETINLKGQLKLNVLVKRRNLKNIKNFLGTNRIMKRFIVKKNNDNHYLHFAYEYNENKIEKQNQMEMMKQALKRMEQNQVPFYNYSTNCKSIVSIDPGGCIPFVLYHYNTDTM